MDPNLTFPNGARLAVSLTYDDGLACHFEDVAPTLENYGLRGTFNLSIAHSSVMEHAAEWRAVAGRGHELGNHSLFHPCRATQAAPKPWLDPAYNLVDYNETRLRDELQVASFVLGLIDGQKDRTYAGTCWDRFIGPEDEPRPIDPILADYFLAVRGTLTNRPVDLAAIDWMNLGSAHIDQYQFADLRAQVEAQLPTGGWLIYTMHGVGEGTHHLFIDREEHRRFVEWLGQNQSRVWTAPMIEVARFLKGRSCSADQTK